MNTFLLITPSFDIHEIFIDQFKNNLTYIYTIKSFNKIYDGTPTKIYNYVNIINSKIEIRKLCRITLKYIGIIDNKYFGYLFDWGSVSDDINKSKILSDILPKISKKWKQLIVENI